MYENYLLEVYEANDRRYPIASYEKGTPFPSINVGNHIRLIGNDCDEKIFIINEVSHLIRKGKYDLYAHHVLLYVSILIDNK